MSNILFLLLFMFVWVKLLNEGEFLQPISKGTDKQYADNPHCYLRESKKYFLMSDNKSNKWKMFNFWFDEVGSKIRN